MAYSGSAADSSTKSPPRAVGGFIRWVKRIIIVVLLLAAIGGGWLYFKFRRLIESEPYQLALKYIRKHPQVIATLGEPITNASWLPGGNLLEEAERGESQLYFTIAGPKGQAKVKTTAQKQADGWGIKTLDVEPDSAAGFSLMREVLLDSGADTPKFDPNAKQPETPPPMLPPPTTDIEIDLPTVPNK